MICLESQQNTWVDVFVMYGWIPVLQLGVMCLVIRNQQCMIEVSLSRKLLLRNWQIKGVPVSVLWSTDTSQAIYTHVRQSQNFLCFTDGEQIASGGGDNLVFLWKSNIRDEDESGSRFE